MKRKLSNEAREKMAAGGRKASKEAKSAAGQKGFAALVAKTVKAALAEAGK